MSEIEIIDFYSRFTADYIAWCGKHPEISDDEEKLEEVFPVQYEKWHTSPKKWLNGKSPVQYFEEIDDEKIYVSMFVSYIENEFQIPEPLIDCIIEKKEKAYPILRNFFFVNSDGGISAEALADVRAGAVSLIDEMQMEHPYGQYISLLIESARPDDDLTEALCIALEDTDKPEEVRKALIEAYPFSEGTARECILDLLCGFPDADGTVFSILCEEFRRDDMELSYVAQLAGKLGDERLLPFLKSALNDKSIDYMTYTSIKYALEKITGEETEYREFAGDPDFDYLANMKDED